jgi:hypothetical protein
MAGGVGVPEVAVAVLLLILVWQIRALRLPIGIILLIGGLGLAVLNLSSGASTVFALVIAGVGGAMIVWGLMRDEQPLSEEPPKSVKR